MSTFIHPFLQHMADRIAATEQYSRDKDALSRELAQAWIEAKDSVRKRCLRNMYPHAVQTWCVAARKAIEGQDARTITDGDRKHRTIRSRTNPAYPGMLAEAFDLLGRCDAEQLRLVFRWNSPRMLRELIAGFSNGVFRQYITSGSVELSAEHASQKGASHA